LIHLAEENGMIIQIGDWMLERACQQLCSWNQLYKPFGPISVNLASAQLHQPGLIAHIQQLLENLQAQTRESETENHRNLSYRPDRRSV
jgi:EAL domain-containing protein (putative c-di-GMP-specific phosphodiesterase class I)